MLPIRFHLWGLVEWGEGTFLVDLRRVSAFLADGSKIPPESQTPEHVAELMRRHGYQNVRRVILTNPHLN